MTIEQVVRLALPEDEAEPKLSELQRLGIALESDAASVWRRLSEAVSIILAWLREVLGPVVRWLFPRPGMTVRIAEMRTTVDIRARQRAARKRRRR